MTHAYCEENVKACLARVDAHVQTAQLAFTHIDRDDALARARELDMADGCRTAHGLLHGLACSVKACFDVRGWVTHAGSAVLAGNAPAQHDAVAVARLRQQGAIILAQTNMTEFAYGALGINERYGTPLSPLYSTETHEAGSKQATGEKRVAGGSSSGAAVSVAMGFADIALCSDTSGSTRIPAAFCGVVGYAPTRGRVPTDGMIGLSPSFDVPGIMAHDVATCWRGAAALVGTPFGSLNPAIHPSTRKLHTFLAPDLDAIQVEPAVLAAFNNAIDRLKSAGVRIVSRPLPFVFETGHIASEGGMIAADAFSIHEKWLANRGAQYDPLIKQRIEAGEQVPAYRYARAMQRLATLALHYEQELDGIDALLTPTCPMVPPLLDDLFDQDVYLRTNKQSFVFTEIANRLNKPSISLPVLQPGAAPIGLLLTGHQQNDRALFEAAACIEAELSGSPFSQNINNP